MADRSLQCRANLIPGGEYGVRQQRARGEGGYKSSVEDPEEIWLQHPNVVTLEARPAPPGSTVPPYRVQDGVDDAMRMAPDWLIVGEVRTGQAALSLFRAQMSDHPGLCTFHAEGAEAAVHRMSVILFAHSQVRMEAAKEIFAQAVDLVVQVGRLEGNRARDEGRECGVQAGV